MHRHSARAAARSLLIVAAVLAAPSASAIAIGQLDDFEDGTTAGWAVALGPGGGVSPTPPVNAASGGPLGANDAFLRMTSLGGAGPGSRLVAMNAAQWAGNYAATGVSSIAMDLRNLGTTDLAVRLYLENPIGGPPTAEAVTGSMLLPAGGGWTRTEFAVTAAALVSTAGDVNALLSNVTVLRIFHGPLPAFPGPTVAAVLGVDNVTALGARPAPVPEPGTAALFVLGLLAATGAARRQRSDRSRGAQAIPQGSAS